MKIYFISLNILLLVLAQSLLSKAQTNQTVLSGENTTAINFGASACKYNWVNDNPAIGLAASGNGDINSFVATNNSSKPITATITATPAGSGFAYIADYFLNIVSVVNLSNNLVVATIPVGLNPTNVDISPDGSLVYVGNYHGGSISVIDAAANTVKKNIITEDYQTGFVLSKNGNYIYALHGNGNFSVINTKTNEVVKTLRLNISTYSLCASPDGKYIYIAAAYNDDVSVFDTQTNTIAYKIPIGAGSNTVTLSPDGLSLYVTARDNSIKVINTVTRSITSTIQIPYPYATAISPDGKNLYVTSRAGGNSVIVINKINTIDNTIIASIPVGEYVEGISLNKDGSRLYVINQVPGTVSVVNTATNSIIADVRVGTNPYSHGTFISSCAAKPLSFTIIVNPIIPVPQLSVSGNLKSLNSIYGQRSVSTNFTVSGKSLTEPVVIYVPDGFELSADHKLFSSTITLGSSGDLEATTIYIRLKSNIPAGEYSGQIQIKSGSGLSKELAMPLSYVGLAPLVITADNKTKYVNTENPLFTITYSGFVNNDKPAMLLQQPRVNSIADKFSPIGFYNITVADASSKNYDISYQDGTLNVVENFSAGVVPNGFSPNGDGINDVWDIKGLASDLKCRVDIFNRLGTKVFSSIGYKIPWDGTSKGKPLTIGAYYYVINFDDGKKVTGSIAILR
ncbi:gliding motility-associated C-terminal domain-containing protein [Pedobacter aquatilis]|uniref:T9SS type B sorting domain-containing protein n=1 Tax=Pedobacter aquatilis TaxID=351343 RepID=UPI00292FDEC9|nr:gliding motility-associated C-terminal domain-containing protein [Pedobacter aquatilis]